MNVTCTAPDPSLGVALRVSEYLGCEGRALGENGFQALTGGPLGAGLLSGLITIFIAFIGYRLILGQTPGVRDGVGWAVRLGIVLALVTGWPAFQTLVYRVAVEGPVELAAVLLPASGLPSDSLELRVQQAYDTIRLGVVDAPPPAATDAPGAGQPTPAAQQVHFQTPLPNTASLLVISTIGISGALQLAIGFLLAVAPLALMALLFDATLGLFNGWIRALAGSALAVLGATIVTAVDLMLVESELAHLQAFRMFGTMAAIDPQALTTIVFLFAIVTVVVLFAAMRMANAFRLPTRLTPAVPVTEQAPSPSQTVQAHRSSEHLAGVATVAEQSRVAAVAGVLARTMHREQTLAAATAAPEAPSRHTAIGQAAARFERSAPVNRLGVAGRRNFTRRTRSAGRRDSIA